MSQCQLWATKLNHIIRLIIPVYMYRIEIHRGPQMSNPRRQWLPGCGWHPEDSLWRALFRQVRGTRPTNHRTRCLDERKWGLLCFLATSKHWYPNRILTADSRIRALFKLRCEWKIAYWIGMHANHESDSVIEVQRMHESCTTWLLYNSLPAGPDDPAQGMYRTLW